MHATSPSTPIPATVPSTLATADTPRIPDAQDIAAVSAVEPAAGLPARLSLARAGSAPALLDGAWWPHSRDLTAEVPALVAALEEQGARVTRVTVNPTYWSLVPHSIPVAGHVVKAGWFKDEQDPHKVMLFSYRTARWDLLVVPPETPPGTAAWLMAASVEPGRVATASGLMAEAPPE